MNMPERLGSAIAKTFARCFKISSASDTESEATLRLECYNLGSLPDAVWKNSIHECNGGKERGYEICNRMD